MKTCESLCVFLCALCVEAAMATGGAHLGGWAGAAGAGKQRGFRVMCLSPQ